MFRRPEGGTLCDAPPNTFAASLNVPQRFRYIPNLLQRPATPAMQPHAHGQKPSGLLELLPIVNMMQRGMQIACAEPVTHMIGQLVIRHEMIVSN